MCADVRCGPNNELAHFIENCSFLAPYIDSEAYLARYFDDGVVRGIRVELANCVNHIAVGCSHGLPFAIDRVREVDGGQHRVLTQFMRHGTGMRIRTHRPRAARPQCTSDACDDSDRKFTMMKDWALLDMQLEVRRNAVLIKIRSSGFATKIFRVESRRIHALREGLLGANMDGRLKFSWPEEAKRRAATKMASMVSHKPGTTLFSANAHDRNVAVEADLKSPQGRYA